MVPSKRYVLNFVILSVAYILLGVILLVAPEASRHIICYILGGVAVLLGIFRVAWHFVKDDLSRAFHSDIPVGVILVIAGIYIFAQANAMTVWLPVLLGFAVVFDSMIKLQHALDLQRTRFNLWWVVLVVALVMAVLGILLIINVFGGLLTYFLGSILIVDGLANVVVIILFTLRMKQMVVPSADAPPTIELAVADEYDAPRGR